MEAAAVAAGTGRASGRRTAAVAHPTVSPAILVFALVLVIACVVPAAQGLRCIRCGEYTDGVGSITPCLNYTEIQHLKDCEANAKFCVKYVTEASIVRECVEDCKEKEAWGTQIYCCTENGCNGAEWTRGRATGPLLLLSAVLLRAASRWALW